METVDSAFQKLMDMESRDLRELMLACSEGHARMCVAAGEAVDPHATREPMQTRIADMRKEDLAHALAPFAALGEIVQGHHPGHGHH